MFALFCLTKNISVRVAAQCWNFFRDMVPCLQLLPSRKKSWFQKQIYNVPSLCRTQVERFIEESEYLFLSIDGTAYESNSKVLAVLLYNQDLDHIIIDSDVCPVDTGIALYEMVKRILGSHFPSVLRKPRGILSDRAKNQLHCNKLLSDAAVEMGNDRPLELACQMHTASNSELYATQILLRPKTLKFLKLFSKLFAAGGDKYVQNSVFIPFQIYCQNNGLNISFGVEKGKRFSVLSLNSRELLLNLDHIKKFTAKLLQKDNYQNNEQLKFISLHLNDKSVINELVTFTGAFIFFSNSAWKVFSKGMSYRVAKDLLNKIIGQLNLGLHADSPLGHLTLMTSNLFPDIIHSTKDLEFAQLFVDHFSSMSDEDLQIYESLMIKFYQRLIQKYNADNTNFLAANLDEDSQITDVPLNNQHIESFFGTFKYGKQGYKFTNNQFRAQAIFNQVIPWVYQQPDQETIIKNASKDKVVNKTNSKTLIQAIQSNPFSHIYDLPSSDEESDQSLSRSESMSSIASDMSVEF